jgi:hypothetical protein
MDDNVRKIWKTFGVFETYEDTAIKKVEIGDKFDAVKIRRSGQGGNRFKIKTWTDPAKKVIKKKSEKKSKN